jgi:acetylornithine/succinyldiaminopimelate/putrescine aminotransferase
MNRGLLTKATHENSVRLAPALVINEKEIMKASRIIKGAVNDIKKLNKERK